jgi:hypothetical protein
MASRQQDSALRGMSMEVDIDAQIPKLKKQGKLHALRKISKLGKITYHMLGFNGDNSVKKEVIARYLSAEVQSQNGSELNVTPDNYKFKFQGLQARDGHEVYVFHVSPKRKEVGLFKGDLWLDPQTCMPVRESGRLVKSPSIFLKRMEFTRVYEIQNGVSIPTRLESLVNTRFFGPVQLNVSFTNFSKPAETDALVGSNELQ